MSLRKSLPTVAAFILALSGIAYAQQHQVTPQDNMRPGQEGPRQGRRGGKMKPHGRPGFMSELKLTEEQQEQQRAITQRHLESTKAQREELFKLREKRISGTLTAEDEARVKTLGQELHNSMQSMRNEIEGILTAEQRARLEQLESERKARGEEMRERHRERRQTVPR